jgi:hypothetical protein
MHPVTEAFMAELKALIESLERKTIYLQKKFLEVYYNPQKSIHEVLSTWSWFFNRGMAGRQSCYGTLM